MMTTLVYQSYLRLDFTRWMASTASQMAWLPPRGTHNITIGSSIRRSLSKDSSAQQHPPQPLRNDFVAMRYNLKPPGVANAAGSLVPSGSYANKESFQLELNAETGERHSFSARSETKKEVDCVLFYDAATGTLVLERLDSLLSLTHEPPATNGYNNIHHNANNGHLLNRPSSTAPVVPATAFPPTPPSTSPPEYTSLPESIRSAPRGTIRTHYNGDSSSSSQHLTADKEPSSQGSTSTLNATAAAATPASPATPSSRKTPQSMSDYAQERRRLHESRPNKRSTTSDFASEPDEEIFSFGSKPTSVPLHSSESSSSNSTGGMPSSNNALRLSDIPSRRAKRKLSDSEPDEEVLEFGRPAQEIKRAKTSSPASISHGTPANIVAESPSESALSPHSRSLQGYQSIPSRSSAAYGTKLVHGSSPLATVAVLSSNSGSDDDDDSDDSEFEEVINNGMSTVTVPGMTVPGGDADAEEDDFLAAAFNDETMALQDDAASNQSDDSSDESDYDER